MTRELVFVDSGLPDLPILLGNLRPGIEAIVLNADASAPAQIAAALEGRAALAAIHILAHGQPGEVSFAAGPLSRTTLPGHATDLARIGRALDGGGLHLWSCRTARGEAGRDFTAALAGATGAPIAAATELVGAADLGGCWTLDASVGDVDAAVPLTAPGIAAYATVLQTRTWTGGSGTSTWEDANNWNPSGVPQDGDDVVVNVAGSSVSIQSNTAALSSLQITTQVTFAGITLDVSGGSGITLFGTGVPGDPAGTLGGSGTILGDIGGTGRVVALNGDLTVAGTVTAGVSFVIDFHPATTLKFTGTATTDAAIAIFDANQTLEVAAGAELTINAAESIGDGTIVLTGGTLTDPAGLKIGSGALLLGFGTVAADIRSGTGTIKAAAGPLVLSGTVESGNTFIIDGNTNGTLKFTGAAAVGSEIAINNANQTLEVGAGGALTLGVAESITNGRIVLSGGALTDQAGLTIGKQATLTGFGAVTANVTTSEGKISATGGTLSIDGTVDNGGTFEVTGGATVTITGAFDSSGALRVDSAAGNAGGSTLTLDSTLANGGGFVLGNAGLSSSATASATALDNLATGSVDLYGNGASKGRLDVGMVSNAGLITVHAGGALDIAGDLEMDGASTLTAQSGGTFTTGTSTTVLKTGAGTTSIIDLEGRSFDNQHRIVVESGSLQFTGTEGLATPELTGAGLIQGEVSLDGSNVLTITPTGLAVGATNVYHFYHTDLELAFAEVVAADGSETITGSNRGETLTGSDFNDTIFGGRGADTIDGLGGDDKLYGRAGIDALDGGTGNDRLDGGAGADVMRGGTGNDLYFVDNTADQVLELPGEGTDTVYAKVDYTLGADEEIEFLHANAGATGLVLVGNRFDNALLGRAGDDTLDGAAGNDSLHGHEGSDTLDGGSGNDKLDGGAGADTMIGGAGDDLFYVDNAGDKVIEAASGGTDAVYSSISYTLASGEEIESLRANAGAVGLTLGGNEFDNTVFGAAGNDVLTGGGGRDKLYGRDGNDTLDGGAGNDRLEGGAGADIFLFDTPFIGVTNVDTVADFEVGVDTIELAQACFAGLSLGQLSATAFALNHATGTAAQIVYSSGSGALYYDSNGADSGGATLFAKVAGAPTLTASDFVVI